MTTVTCHELPTCLQKPESVIRCLPRNHPGHHVAYHWLIVTPHAHRWLPLWAASDAHPVALLTVAAGRGAAFVCPAGKGMIALKRPRVPLAATAMARAMADSVFATPATMAQPATWPHAALPTALVEGSVYTVSARATPATRATTARSWCPAPRDVPTEVSV